MSAQIALKTSKAVNFKTALTINMDLNYFDVVAQKTAKTIEKN